MNNMGCDNVDSSLSYCYFFGAYSVGYAIKDCLNILHTPSGCQRRILYLWSMHDNSSNYRLTLSTNIIDKNIIFGTEDQLENVVSNTLERYNPKMILIITSCAPEIIGINYEIALSKFDDLTETKILAINSAGFRGDFYQGFKDTLANLVKSLPVFKEKEKDTVNIIGYFYSRYEEDENSNVAELARLIEGIGLKINVVFMSGCECAHLEQYSKAEYNIIFPYGEKSLNYLEELGTQKNIVCNIPLGIDGTVKFIEKVAKETNHVCEGKEFIKKELKLIIPKIESTIHIISNSKVAIFADEQNIFGMVCYILEIGMIPSVVGCFNDNVSIREDIYLLIDENSTIKYRPVIIDKCTRENVKNTIRKNYVDFVIGSSIESRDLEELGIPVLEFEFPLFEKHYNFSSPTLGFNGALNINTVIYNTLNKHELRRYSVIEKLNEIKNDKYFLFEWIEDINEYERS